METNDEELLEKDQDLKLDFSKQSLKKVERAHPEHQSATTLVLDHNEIQKLDNVETYQNLKKLSLIDNQLIRMYSLSTLTHLVELDLSQNSLVTIEGLKEMSSLKILKLARNKIKTIEHLNHNFNLEVIDLSENKIQRISDISHLIHLKELYLHDNKIVNLSHSDKKIPSSLKILTLNNNNLVDLNEISHLSSLTSLEELSLLDNPCLNFSEHQKFNYRPFVKNWCCSLVVLDYRPLDDLECLKAEWLYSQGRGRSFKVGEHAALVEYLVSVCPKEKEENAETEDVKKLKLILSKAQLHQQQLRQQGESFKSLIKKKVGVVPERMVLSFQDSPPVKDMKSFTEVMTQSLDSGIGKKSMNLYKTDSNQAPLQTSTSFVPIPDSLISPDVGQPIGTNPVKTPPFSSRTSRSSSRNSSASTPENKRRICNTRIYYENSSPVATRSGERSNHLDLNAEANVGKNVDSKIFPSVKKRVSKSKTLSRSNKETSEDDLSDTVKLKTTHLTKNLKKNKVTNSKKGGNNEKKENVFEKTDMEGNEVNDDMWKAAVCIQRRWRGYRARNLNREVLSGCKMIQMDRMQDYLTKVLSDMETTRLALEGNRKLVILQMQAINALWKKTTGLAIGSQSNDNKTSIQDLVETCSILNKQVEALQIMVKNLQSTSKPEFSVPIATQTEIIAVHTPKDETRVIFPCKQSLEFVANDGISLGSVEDEDIKVTTDSVINSTSANTTEIYTIYDDNKKDTKNSSERNFFDDDLPKSCENLTKPSISLNKASSDISSPMPKETEQLETNLQSQNNCEP